MEILQKILTVIFIINCILLVIIILLQSNRSAGMSLFGGGGSQSAFGSSSADVLTKTTGVMTAIFLLLGLTIAFLETSGGTEIQELKKEFAQEATQESPSDTDEVEDQDDAPAPSTAPLKKKPKKP